MMLSDAFDVTFYGTKGEVRDYCPDEGVMFAAEKNCYPDPGIRDRIQTPRPWAFANGGLFIGCPEEYLKWCEEMERHPSYEPRMNPQAMLNILVAENKLSIDYETELFFCLFGGYDELRFDNGRPYNTVYGTWPCFLHANGKWPAADAFERHRLSLLHPGSEPLRALEPGDPVGS